MNHPLINHLSEYDISTALALVRLLIQKAQGNPILKGLALALVGLAHTITSVMENAIDA